jgi:hypothetical protein
VNHLPPLARFTQLNIFCYAEFILHENINCLTLIGASSCIIMIFAFHTNLHLYINFFIFLLLSISRQFAGKSTINNEKRRNSNEKSQVVVKVEKEKGRWWMSSDWQPSGRSDETSRHKTISKRLFNING